MRCVGRHHSLGSQLTTQAWALTARTLLDSCLIGLLATIPVLSSVLHTAARIIFLKGRSNCVLPLLNTLRWLPLRAGVKAKGFIVVYGGSYGLQGSTPVPLVTSFFPSPLDDSFWFI